MEEKHTVSEGGFDKLPASDKIRLLLSQFGISKVIPPNPSFQTENTYASQFSPIEMPLNDLIQLAQDSNWVDGPHALTEIRNGITHPKKKKREKVYQASFEAKYEVANLGLWYLELVLLAMFNYQGNYENRLLINAPPQPVPWS